MSNKIEGNTETKSVSPTLAQLIGIIDKNTISMCNSIEAIACSSTILDGVNIEEFETEKDMVNGNFVEIIKKDLESLDRRYAFTRKTFCNIAFHLFQDYQEDSENSEDSDPSEEGKYLIENLINMHELVLLYYKSIDTLYAKFIDGTSEVAVLKTESDTIEKSENAYDVALKITIVQTRCDNLLKNISAKLFYLLENKDSNKGELK